MKRLAVLTLLLFPATASAAHESTMAHNPAIRADFSYATHYWGKNPHRYCPGGVRVEVRSGYMMGDPHIIGNTNVAPLGTSDRYCEVWIRWGLGACTRRVVMVHEFGHVFGLRFYPGFLAWNPFAGRYEEDHTHSPDPSSIMYPAVGAWNHPELCR